MFLDPLVIAGLLLLGSVAGFLAGLLGVGGGMMMVPFLTWFLTSREVEAGLAVKMAIATSMATILFTSISSVRAHHQRGAVRWDLWRAMAPGIVIGGLASGGAAFALVKGRALALSFALFVGFAATRMLFVSKPRSTWQLPGPLGLASVGAGIGFVSGLVGAGGAFMSVPFMGRCGVAIHQAVATSAAIGLPIALANTVGYVIGGWQVHSPVPGSLGFLVLPMLVIISVASISTAPLGARLAHSMNVSQLKKLFALLLYGLAIYMGWRGLA